MADGAHNGPVPFDESDLLACVEGEPLSAPRAAALQRLLAADPRLASRVQLLRADRDALASLRDEQAPADLIDAVLSAVEPTLERRMLLDLEHAAPDCPPVSLVQPARASVFETVLSHRAWRFAAAAALLLVVGGVAWLLVPAIGGIGGPQAPRIARGPVQPDVPADPSPGPEVAPVGEAATTMIASAPDQGDAEGVSPLPDDMVVADAGSAPEPLAEPDLVRLAGERRLVLVVRAPNVELAASRLERAADRRPGMWRVSPQVPSAVEIVLARSPEAPPIAERSSTLPPETILASTEPWAREPMRRFIEPRPAQPMVQAAQGDRLFVVESRLDDASITALRAALASVGGEADVRILDEPLPGDGEVLSPAAVLWWQQPPASWTRWAAIPVVIERSR